MNYPVATAYAEMLGRALFNFAILEWNVVNIADRLQPGFASDFLQRQEQTSAGKLARQFESLVATAAAPAELRPRLYQLAESFKAEVKLRNTLIHAQPCTAPETGDQVLSRWRQSEPTKIWTLEEVAGVGREFGALAVEAGQLLHSAPLSR